MKEKRVRSARGAGLIYGIFAITSILIGSAAGTVLVMNIGYGTIYDEKLARVNPFAAQYAAAHAQDGSSEAAIKAYTENLMLAMGLVPKNVSINVISVNTASGPSVQVTVANQFRLFGSQGLLPTQVTLHDTVASAAGSDD